MGGGKLFCLKKKLREMFPKIFCAKIERWGVGRRISSQINNKNDG
jgi:hypothetical protein